MSAYDLRLILSEYGIQTDDSFEAEVPEFSYAETHENEQDLIPIRY